MVQVTQRHIAAGSNLHLPVKARWLVSMYTKAKQSTGDSSKRRMMDLLSLSLISHRNCIDLFESLNTCIEFQELENIMYFRLSFSDQDNR
jgi:hypothetical protein